MSRFLRNTNRSMVISCSWPFYSYKEGAEPNYTHVAEHCNLWRNYGDIDPSFSTIADIIEWFAQNYNDLYMYARPGAWHDPDMLVVGNKELRVNYARAQMAMWSILGGPMLMSNDLREIRPEFKQLLLNKNLIAINQDEAVDRMGRRLGFEENVQIWKRELRNESVAFVFYYPDPYSTRWTTLRFWIAVIRYLFMMPVQLSIDLRELGLTGFDYYTFYESFTGESIGYFDRNATFSKSIEPFGGMFAFLAQPSK
jgi:alpha-N-acetylgalactosaminidase